MRLQGILGFFSEKGPGLYGGRPLGSPRVIDGWALELASGSPSFLGAQGGSVWEVTKEIQEDLRCLGVLGVRGAWIN